MPYFFVCDGGGSKTESLLFDEDANILAVANGDGANALFIDPEQAFCRVYTQIKTTLQEAGLTLEQLHTVALFIPGFHPCQERMRQALPAQVRLRVEGDDRNAFYGALGTHKGIAVLSGTGSFAVGMDAFGNLVSAGGWGPVMGDEGSGYDIGRMCLQKLGHLADERKFGGYLERLVLQAWNQPDILSLRCYVSQLDRSDVARLCPLVMEAARNQDPDACKILDEAADALAKLVKRVTDKLGESPQCVVLIGGVAKAGQVFTERFARSVHAMYPQAVCREPEYSPVQGAALCILQEEAGVDIQNPTVADHILKGAKKAV